MDKVTQLAETKTETSGHISIAMENEGTGIEPRTKSPPEIPKMGDSSDDHLPGTETSSDLSVAKRKLRIKKKTFRMPMLNRETRSSPRSNPDAKKGYFRDYPSSPGRHVSSPRSNPDAKKGYFRDYPSSPGSHVSSSPRSNPDATKKGYIRDYPFSETETGSHVSIAIQNDPTSMEQRTMRRVPQQLLEVNERAYQPFVICFGPYHSYLSQVQEMEERKVESVNRLLQPINQNSDKIHLSATRDKVKEAFNCYDESHCSKEDFVKMMVLDGCFIIQLITGTLTDPFCTKGLIYTSILRDLVLVENQLPFFVLCDLLDKIPKRLFKLEGSTDPKGRFINQLLKRFKDTMPGLRVDTAYDDDSMKNVKHIVHLLHSNWLPSDEAINEYKKHPKDGKWHFIRSATELREAGIEFKMAETEGNEKRSLFDIKFERGKGTLVMTKVTIEDDTESLYRNLIACEQFDNVLPVYLLDYVTVMNCLINTGKDVELLCKSKIIDNLLGDDDEVATLFNRLGDHAKFSRKAFFYAQLFNEINEHYEKPWNTWKANLRQKYFNTPWAVISVFAATLLILLTVLQTTFTVFPRS